MNTDYTYQDRDGVTRTRRLAPGSNPSTTTRWLTESTLGIHQRLAPTGHPSRMSVLFARRRELLVNRM